MDISEFIQTRPTYPSLPDDYWENAEYEDETYCNAWLQKYPEQDHNDIKERLEYIRRYSLQFPDFDGEKWEPEQSAYRHYDARSQKIANCGLSESEFYDFDILQDAITDLGLSPKATFEFILYLWHELYKWLYRGNIEMIDSRIKRLIARIDARPNDKLELDIKVGGKHFRFSNEHFIKSLIANYVNSNIESGAEEIYPTKREIDYILICTLLRNLPIKHKKQKKGTFSQAERNLGLCVLWLTGELNHKKGDDPADYCAKDNNATFDKLIRDYKDMPLPIISPLF